MHRVLTTFLLACFVVLAPGSAFVAPSNPNLNGGGFGLGMGFLDDVFGGGSKFKSASASHILIKGPGANDKCEKLKGDIYKKAIGRGDASKGVAPDKLMSAFAQQAKKSSTCPSKSKGGSLGSFGPGEMVPEFDAVVFNDQVGVIHGPVVTDFGSHLIIVTDRT